MTKLLAQLLAGSLAILPIAVPAHADQIDDLLAAEMARSGTPGMAIAVVDDGRITRLQGSGLANVEHRVSAHSDTLFKTGATGMQFTAAAIMLLVEDGLIDLDAPVGRYLAAAPARWSGVTIRHLLDHTSGLPATPNGDFRTDYTNAELLAIIAAQDINFPAGERWRFSYAGYIVLGFVIEEVSAEHWASFIQRRIFSPLGMHTARGIDEMAIIPNRAAGYEWREQGMRNAEWISQTANSTADGSLYLSVTDYAIWAQAVSERRLLSPQSWDALARPAALNGNAACPHVPGWMVAGAQNGGRWQQSGSWQGFQAQVLRYPARDLSIVVFANGELADVQGVARALAGIADPELAGQQAMPARDADPDKTARARQILEAVSAGEADAEEFAGFADLDLREMLALYQGMLANAGELQEIALFASNHSCGERQERYRARLASGMFELRLGFEPEGRIGNLEIVPLVNWNDPL